MQIDPMNSDFCREVSKSLKHVQDVLKILMRVKKVEATYLDWGKLHLSVEYGIQILRFVMEFERDPTRLDTHKRQLNSLVESLDHQVSFPVRSFV